jgi:hypothetical protein
MENPRCNPCKLAFSSKTLLSAHLDDVHVTTNKTCFLCQVEVSTRANLARHLKEVHFGLASPKNIKCPNCESMFNEKRFVFYHFKSVHLKMDKYGKILKCPSCDFSSTNDGVREHFYGQHCKVIGDEAARNEQEEIRKRKLQYPKKDKVTVVKKAKVGKPKKNVVVKAAEPKKPKKEKTKKDQEVPVVKSVGCEWEGIIEWKKTVGQWTPVPGKIKNVNVCSECNFEGVGKMGNIMLRLHVRQNHKMFHYEDMIEDRIQEIEDEEKVDEEAQDENIPRKKDEAVNVVEKTTPPSRPRAESARVTRSSPAPKIDLHTEEYDVGIIDGLVGKHGFTEEQAAILKDEIKRGDSETNTFNRMFCCKLIQGKFYNCVFCSSRFTNASSMKRHLNREHLLLTKSFACSVCPTRFHDKRILDRHTKLVHERTNSEISSPTADTSTQAMSPETGMSTSQTDAFPAGSPDSGIASPANMANDSSQTGISDSEKASPVPKTNALQSSLFSSVHSSWTSRIQIFVDSSTEEGSPDSGITSPTTDTSSQEQKNDAASPNLKKVDLKTEAKKSVVTSINDEINLSPYFNSPGGGGGGASPGEENVLAIKNDESPEAEIKSVLASPEDEIKVSPHFDGQIKDSSGEEKVLVTKSEKSLEEATAETDSVQGRPDDNDEENEKIRAEWESKSDAAKLIDVVQASKYLDEKDMCILLDQVEIGKCENNIFTRTQQTQTAKLAKCKLCPFQQPNSIRSSLALTRHLNAKHLRLLAPVACQAEGCGVRATVKHVLKTHVCKEFEGEGTAPKKPYSKRALVKEYNEDTNAGVSEKAPKLGGNKNAKTAPPEESYENKDNDRKEIAHRQVLDGLNAIGFNEDIACDYLTLAQLMQLRQEVQFHQICPKNVFNATCTRVEGKTIYCKLCTYSGIDQDAVYRHVNHKHLIYHLGRDISPSKSELQQHMVKAHEDQGLQGQSSSPRPTTQPKMPLTPFQGAFADYLNQSA